MRQPSPQNRGVSLERKLPLLIGGLVAAALVATLLLVYYELRNSALAASEERLGVVSEQLAQTLDRSLETRLTLYRRVSAQRELVSLLDGTSSDIEAARPALASLRLPSDNPAQPIVLVTATGRAVVGIGDVPPAETLRAVQRSTEISFSPLEGDSAAYRYWVSVPVTSRGIVLGHILQRRAGNTGSPAVAQVEALLGSQIQLLVANDNDGVWVEMDGGVIGNALAEPDTTRAFVFAMPDQRRFLATARPIDGTPWLIVAAMPLDAVTARTDNVIRRMALVGALLLTLGLVAAWLLSRSVTAPLRRLAGAANAIAAGDYSRRAKLGRDDEIGRLATSFDAMASRVESTHAQLEQRYHQAQSLAAELELTNSRLQRAMHEAELARTEALQASRAKSEFLATMSHEIRTPINAIVGYTDLMDMRLPGPLTGEQEDYVRRIRMSSEHLISLVNDVLDFAKIESGQMRIARETVSARAAIDAAVSMLHGRASARGVRLMVNVPEDMPFCGDPQRAQQILLNLLSNALKFTNEGGAVEISCERRESRGISGAADDATTWTCITVRDDGIGIAADQTESIFEPFVQGTGGYTRTHGGTGLGLAISRSLARMMDGDLTVESEPGAGSTFTVWLPHAPVTAAVSR